MKDKIVLVTGANSGMGKATCIELARLGAKVVMLCRDNQRGNEALKEVKEQSKNNSVELMLCDLGSIKEIKEFTKEFKIKFEKLDILINNAGVILPGKHRTKDGFELQFGVNHLGHFLLTNELLDWIKNSPSGRIVNVSSGAHKIGRIDFKDINLDRNYTLWRAYAQSKLANILFTYELAKRLKETNITANCLHPGAVATNMGVNRKTDFGRLITRMLKPFFQTPREGADTAMYLATSSEVEGVTGKYFYKKKPIKSSMMSYDEQLAQKLWKFSEELIEGVII